MYSPVCIEGENHVTLVFYDTVNCCACNYFVNLNGLGITEYLCNLEFNQRRQRNVLKNSQVDIAPQMKLPIKFEKTGSIR